MFHADPNIGGRYSALSAFGLVPTGLAGVPVERAARPGRRRPRAALSGDDATTPRLELGAALGGFGRAGHDKVVLADAGSGISASATGPSS